MTTLELKQKISEQDVKLAEIEKHFAGGIREIHSYNRYGADENDNENPTLALLADRWKSVSGGLQVLHLIYAQKINPFALDQYRDDLQR